MDTLLQHCSIPSNFSNKKQQLEVDAEVENIENDLSVVLYFWNEKGQLNDDSVNIPKKRGKYGKGTLYFTNPETGERSVMTSRHSVWWQRYIINTEPDHYKWAKSFHNCFRMPYHCYLDLVEQCQSSPLFKKWSTKSYHQYNKKQPTSIHLLVLCVLRYLDWG